ncbi:MAG TPA: hypothetical protein VGL59_14520 [Polyangia bacterium]|jgi:hypothetical protein
MVLLAWAGGGACGGGATSDAGTQPEAPAADSVGPPESSDSAVAEDRAVDLAVAADLAVDLAAEVSGERPGGVADSGAIDSGAGEAPLRCNGYPELCDRRFDEVAFPAAHNAMSNADDGWIAPDQVHNIPQQLADGIRAMLIDSYPWLGDFYLCHTSCLLGSKRLADSLGEMAAFLRQNPNEVLTLVFEDYISAADTNTAFVESGLDQFVYTHVAGSAWPTLRQMITDGHRVFVGAQTAGPPPDWYHHFYDLAWDTPYSFKTTADFSCALNRGKIDNDLFLLNHWLENPLPDATLSATANTRAVLLGRAQQCQQESGKRINFVAVNHYSVGDLFAVVRALNGL